MQGEPNPWTLVEWTDEAGQAHPDSLAVLTWSTSGSKLDSQLAQNGHIRRVPITGLIGPATALVTEHARGGQASLELVLMPWRYLRVCGDKTCPCGNPGQSVAIKNPKGAAWGASLRRALEHAVRREPRGALPAPPPSLPPAASATAKPAAKPASGGGSATWSKGSPCQYPAESGGYRLGEVVTVNKTPGHLGVKPFHPRLAEVEVKTSLVRMWNVDDNSTVTDCPPLTKCLMSTPPADASEAEMFEYYENVERLKISFNCASIPAVVKMVESEAETLFA